MNFAVGLSEVAVVVSICIGFGFGLIAGGPVLLVWGFLFAFIMSMLVALTMAEICGAYPSAGSVYHWAAQLCPIVDAPFWSYVCGWANWIGNAAGDASFANAFSMFTSAAIAASGFDPLPSSMQVTCSVLVLIIWTALNFVRIDQVGWINSLAAVVHIATIILLFILLLTVAPSLNTPQFVFTQYYDDTGFNSVLYVCMLSVVTGMFAFVGYEASSHLAEETAHGDSAAAAGMVWTVAASGVLGFAFIVILLFLTVDINAALNGTSIVNTGNVGMLNDSTYSLIM